MTHVCFVRYLDYLEAFSAKFDLIRHIKFRTKVLEIRKSESSGKWLVTSKGGQAVEPHRTYGPGKRKSRNNHNETLDRLPF